MTKCQPTAIHCPDGFAQAKNGSILWRDFLHLAPVGLFGTFVTRFPWLFLCGKTTCLHFLRAPDSTQTTFLARRAGLLVFLIFCSLPLLHSHTHFTHIFPGKKCRLYERHEDKERGARIWATINPKSELNNSYIKVARNKRTKSRLQFSNVWSRELPIDFFHTQYREVQLDSTLEIEV